MAAATADRDGQRQPSELISYSGGSGYLYYKNTLLMRIGTAASNDGTIRPLAAAGACQGTFLGVVSNRVDLSAGLGASQATIDTWKTGEFTLQANGTGVSGDIGLIAYALDDQTVGTSMAFHSLAVGEIVGLPRSTQYRVRINGFTGKRAGHSSASVNAI